MATKLEQLLTECGLDGPEAVLNHTKNDAINYALLRSVFRLMTTVEPVASHDPMGHYAFRWKEDSTSVGLVKLTFLVQPEIFYRLPHEHNADSQDVDVQVDPLQLFALAFECISTAVERIIPTVNEEAQTMGPCVFYTRDMYLKLYIPGVQ